MATPVRVVQDDSGSFSFKPFDDDAAYRRPAIKAKLGNPSERKLDTMLADVPRLALSPKFIVYPGKALNALVAQAARRGATKATPTGAAANGVQA